MGTTLPGKVTDAPLSEVEKKVFPQELEAIKLAETARDYSGAKQLLDKVIATCPTYSSAYNNRAQLYRLLGDRDLALADANEAIRHARQKYRPSVLRLALCQRGILRREGGHPEEAFNDFEEAGKLGLEDARKMAVACNPYAKLCNSIVQEMLDKLYYSLQQ